MTRYVTGNKQSPLIALEIDSAGDENIAVFYCRGKRRNEVRTVLQESGIAYEELGKSRLDNDPAFVVKTKADINMIGAALQPKVGAIHVQKEVQNDEPIDLMKLRGWLGNIGQVLIIASGVSRRKFDKGALMKASSAGASLGANGINMVYGVQRREDVEGLEDTKQSVNDEVLADLDSQEGLPDIHQRLTKNEEAERPDAFLRENSTMVSDAIKLVAKGIEGAAGQKSGNPLNAWSGWLSQGSKVITLAGKDKDNKEKKPPETPVEYVSWFVNNIRENAMAYSGVTEFNANVMKIGGCFPAGMPVDKLQLIGTSFILVGLAAKSMAPFSIKEVDQDELYAHSGLALSMLPADKRNEHMLHIAEEIKSLEQNKDMPLSGIYVRLMQEVDKSLQEHHGKAVPSSNALINASNQGTVEQTANKQIVS